MLSGKVCLITGSTAGIGKAMARKFLQEGAIVFVNGRSEKSVNACLKSLESDGLDVSRAHGVVADVSTSQGAEALFSQVSAVSERVDVLVNNMGVFESADFFALEEEKWAEMFDANVISTVRMTKKYLRQMLDRNSGRVIIVSSVVGVTGKTSLPHYSATKAAQINIARTLALLTKGTKVTVNALLPGLTMTDGMQSLVKDYASQTGSSQKDAEAKILSQLASDSLLERYLAPEEVANAGAFLASDMSSGINGTAQRVEGGAINNP